MLNDFLILSHINHSFAFHMGYPLPVAPNIDNRFEWLHTQAPYSLLAHNNSDDPTFTYANQRAVDCFKYPKEEFIGLPSRFSASEADRPARQKLLLEVKQKGIAGNYTGVRVDKFNHEFTIYDGIVWQIYNEKEELTGQAALFWPDNQQRPAWFTHQFIDFCPIATKPSD